MIELTIEKEEAGRKLARFLEKILPQAPRSFLYKAVRCNKVKVNGKKPADLSFTLQAGDTVRLYLTDEQLSDFGYRTMLVKQETPSGFPAVPVLYEDEHLLILDKPAGMLSQKSKPGDISLTEIGVWLLEKQGCSLRGYRPGVSNRLDRNTSGAVIMAKTLEASQAVARMLQERRIGKFYWALVQGRPEIWKECTELVHGWRKNEAQNKAELRPWQEGQKGWQRIESRVRLLKAFTDYSLVEIQLMTGKSHQIRSQLAAAGFPIWQDGKYNPDAKAFRPMLVAKRLEFYDCPSPLETMKGRCIEASVPEAMQKLLMK